MKQYFEIRKPSQQLVGLAEVVISDLAPIVSELDLDVLDLPAILYSPRGEKMAPLMGDSKITPVELFDRTKALIVCAIQHKAWTA